MILLDDDWIVTSEPPEPTSLHETDLKRNSSLGTKTERKQTELSSATFVFIFFSENRNGYRNFENKYENRY
jgi:hypothetical protein